MFNKPEIIIVDDHLIFRNLIKSILSIENIATVIGEASDGVALIGLLPYLNPDLVLMDIDMPNMNGIDATRKALEMRPDLKIIAFTMFGDEEYYYKMIGLGVKGFILKSSGINELENAILQVMKGECYFTMELNHKFANNFKHQNTSIPDENIESTAIEMEVIQQVSLGLTIAEIGSDLSVRVSEKHR